MSPLSQNREILRLAAPNILSNLSVPLLGLVDTALMGRMESEIYIGAVALGSVIFNFIYWGFGFLRMGTTGLTAQAYGREDRSETIAIFGRGLLVAGVGSLLLIIAQELIVWIGFGLLQGDAFVKEAAVQYFRIRIYAAPATLALYVFHGWFLGVQNARYPMLLTVAANAANIGFSIWFVYGTGMKSDGVALGTVCAQYLGLLLAAALFLKSYRGATLEWSARAVLNLESLKKFCLVNVDIFIRTICLIFTFAFFISASAGMDSMILAANQILLQYLSIMAYGVDGFAFAAESLVGRYTGSGDKRRLRRAVGLLFAWGVGIGVVFALIYGLFGQMMLFLFTDQEVIIQAAAPFVWWMILISPVGAVAYMWDGIYIGAMATKPMRNWMVLATLGVFLPSYYCCGAMLGNHALWLAMFLFMLARGVSLGISSRRRIFLT